MDSFVLLVAASSFVTSYPVEHPLVPLPLILAEVHARKISSSTISKRYSGLMPSPVAYENERRVREGKPIYTPEEYEERIAYHLEYIPYKLTAARYHSFRRYFHWLKQLEWVEFTGEEEMSSLQEVYPPGPPRRYYRLTRKGIEAPDYEWSRPQLTLYPEIKGQPGLEYFRENRKKHHYSKKSPTKSRR